MSVALLWFRRDLRLADNPALSAALKAYDEVVPVFVHAPDEEAPWPPGAASSWWLHHSLVALDADLRRRGSALQIRRGPTLDALRALVRETGAHAVHWNRLYEPAAIARDRRIKKLLRADGIDAQSFNGALLFDPWLIATGQGEPYKVFTPFWRNVRAKIEVRPPSSAPRRLGASRLRGSLAIEALNLLPRIPWDAGFHEVWRPGEAGARKMLRRFVGGAVDDYATRRDFPGKAGTSRLSPHLHFGEISPMQILWALREKSEASAKYRQGAEAYLSEIGWREFSHHLLYHFPKSTGANLNPAFERFK